MSYLVLARKWRPRRFSELVGQEHVVRALSNALESGRVHHAFLFTGTRGVGKTTIARIFSKSLNCVRGVGAEPCGECDICQAVDQGRFVDLLEIDAASNTGVDDVREVIENAQYMPTQGRYKVYLIDEVHMLSKNAFNALLKTLEEPPEHVKFLLATTDPQKMPITVLSRCMQFNLRRLTQEQIAGQMQHILTAEGVEAERGAIAELARAADGSLRDGLSLLDQALAFGGGALLESDVRSMLGSVDRTRIQSILAALAADDGAAVMQEAATVAGFSPDFAGVLDALAYALHRIQVQQLVPEAAAECDGVDVATLAGMLSPEQVQLWYQMAILGRRDVGLAPTPQVGFEMTLLRMLAFRREGAPATAVPSSTAPQSTRRTAPPAPAAIAAPARQIAESTPVPRPIAQSVPPVPVEPATPPAPVRQIAETATPVPSPQPAAVNPSPAGWAIVDNDSWLEALERSGIAGPVRELGGNLQFVGTEDGRIRVFLPPSHEYLKTELSLSRLCEALGKVTGTVIRFEFTAAAGKTSAETFAARQRRAQQQREDDASMAFAENPLVRQLVEEGATIRAESVRPH